MSDRLSNALFVATGYTAIAIVGTAGLLFFGVCFILLALSGTWGVVAAVLLLVALLIAVGTAFIYVSEPGDGV